MALIKIQLTRYLPDKKYLCLEMETKAKILLILYLFSFTCLREIVKVPILVQHYFHHLGEHPDMSLKEFFTMHYLQGIIVDEDFEQDMQLPFKSVDLSNFNMVGIYNHNLKEYQLHFISDKIQQKITPRYSFLYQNPNSANIFHPPRLA